MPKEITQYLASQRTGVLSVEMPNGAPHGATLHFANSDEPLIFYFQTFSDSVKAQALLAKESVRATFVIGTDESRMATFQMDGIAEVIKADEEELYKNTFFGKFPEKLERVGPKSLSFKFTPTWWRFCDFKNPGGKLVLTSN